MKEQFITSLTANLAKQAGFDWKVGAYFINGKFYRANFYENYNKHILADYKTISAPTQSVLQRWLREVKDVVILVWFNNDEDCDENERYGVDVFIRNKRVLELTTYPTYEEALETGSQICLRYIIENL